MKRELIVSTVIMLLLIILYGDTSFADVHNKHWAQDVLTDFIKNGYVDESFNEASLNSLVTKGELANTINLYYSYGESDSYENAISIAEDIGYMKNANVDENVSREETCAIFCKLIDTDNYTEPISFIDTDEISDWALPYVSAMIRDNIIIGYPDNSFRPLKLLTKAEFIMMLSRIEGMGGADEEEMKVVLDEIEDIEVGIIDFSGDYLFVRPIEGELTLESGDKVFLSIALPENVQDDELIVEDFDNDIVDYDYEIGILTAISSGDTTITFRTQDSKYVKKINLNIY